MNQGDGKDPPRGPGRDFRPSSPSIPPRPYGTAPTNDDRSFKPKAHVVSAGILLVRFRSEPEFFLVHPGGPFFLKKDYAVWSIPKGTVNPGEDPLSAAIREFEEETGFPRPGGPYTALGDVRQRSGKTVYGWACVHDVDAHKVKSNLFELEWPRNSGIMRKFPEVDKAAWFTEARARQKMIDAQFEFIQRVLRMRKVEEKSEEKVEE